MKLTSLIQILFSSVIEEECTTKQFLILERNYRLSFRTKEELESKVANIYNVFEDSDEAITEPKLVSDWILNRMDIKTYVPNLEKIESLFKRPVNGLSLDELKEVDPEGYGFLYKSLVEMRNQEFAKEGMKYIDLTKDEMYQLFSQSSFRNKRLNQIVAN